MKRRYSLKRNKEFRAVYRTGKSVTCKHAVLVYKTARSYTQPRVGFSVSKKIGNSVVRNRVKRRLREAFLPYLSKLSPCSIIIIARAPAVSAEFTELIDSIGELLRKAGVQNDGERQ